jgi:isopentenyl diphosphate isomerase/L-lactate dehydrogenase-like FMN-dependent dehydrogenase
MRLSYVYGHDRIVADFVAQMIPTFHGRTFDATARAMGVIDEVGHLIAGIVWHNWEPEAQIIEISAAALPRQYWMTRETLARMYGYPFIELGCQMVVQRVPADDKRQRRMLAAFGFAQIEVPRMYGRDRDGVIATLTFEAWGANKFMRREARLADQSRKAA